MMADLSLYLPAEDLRALDKHIARRHPELDVETMRAGVLITALRHYLDRQDKLDAQLETSKRRRHFEAMAKERLPHTGRSL